jgi:GrpB-like predicted nucleotidyltransferase (UPF0157 family)
VDGAPFGAPFYVLPVRIYRFDAEVARPIDRFGSDFRLSAITGMDDGVRVVVFHLAPNGRVGRHVAVTKQLLCVSAGSCWVAGAAGDRHHLATGYAASWEEGEEHEVWTDDEPMTAFVLEGDFAVWAPTVKGKPIVVEDHDPVWREWFEQVRDHVLPAFDGMPVSIEHVGSTSVPGLAAKPIVDVDVVVPTEGRVKPAIDRLETVGYLHRGDLGVDGREAFVSAPDLPRHHLYLVVEGSKAHLDHVLLRDHLRQHPDDARRYGDLKKTAAAEVDDDMELYLARKHDLVEELLARAREGQGRDEGR